MSSYRVAIDAFEGPFDLLLQLVTRHKLDVAAIPLSQVADQYLEHIERMRDVDLEVSSDFLYVASVLLELKSAALLPEEQAPADPDDELAGLTADEARDVLTARLVAYRQCKNVAAMLEARHEAASRLHPRHAPLEPRFLNLMPDYLEGVTLPGLAVICADLAARRETFLLEADHVASLPIPLEAHAESVARTVRRRGSATFAELVGDTNDPAIVVVTFLAVLELFKRGEVTMRQAETFGRLDVGWLGDPSAAAPDAKRDGDEADDAGEKEGEA